MTYSNRDSIKGRLAYKMKYLPGKGGVYLIKCIKADCESLYIGQSKDVPRRLGEHTGAKTQPSKMYYTSAKHKGGGHSMDTSNGVVVYESSSLLHRIVMYACLAILFKGTKHPHQQLI